MVAASVVTTILILNYHHRNQQTHTMPYWVRLPILGPDTIILTLLNRYLADHLFHCQQMSILIENNEFGSDPRGSRKLNFPLQIIHLKKIKKKPKLQSHSSDFHYYSRIDNRIVNKSSRQSETQSFQFINFPLYCALIKAK